MPETARSLWSAQQNIVLPKFHTYLSFLLMCAMGHTTQYVDTASVLTWGCASGPGLAGLWERKLKSRSVKFLQQKSSLVTAAEIPVPETDYPPVSSSSLPFLQQNAFSVFHVLPFHDSQSLQNWTLHNICIWQSTIKHPGKQSINNQPGHSQSSVCDNRGLMN